MPLGALGPLNLVLEGESPLNQMVEAISVGALDLIPQPYSPPLSLF